jgi:hypothetical protein
VLIDSLQRGDRPDYEGMLELFLQSYHEPYYESYTRACTHKSRLPPGLIDVRKSGHVRYN